MTGFTKNFLVDPNTPGPDDYWVDTKTGDSIIRPWDKLVLGASPVLTFPGIWTVEPTTTIDFNPFKWQTNPDDVQNAPTSNPVAPKYDLYLEAKGYNPARIRATGTVWTPFGWTQLQQMLPLIAPKKPNSSAPIPWPINHPATEILGIDAVVITSVSLPRIVNQTLTIIIEMIQFFPQMPIFGIYGNQGALTQKQAGEAPNTGANIA